MAVIDKLAGCSGAAVVGLIHEELVAVSASDAAFRSQAIWGDL